MSNPKDAFSKSVSVDIAEHIVSIKTRNKSIFKFALYFFGIFFLIFWISIQGLNIGSLFLFAVLAVVSYLAFQELRISMYSITILDLKQKSVLRKSWIAFVKPKLYSFNRLTGVSMSTQAVGGYASAYEDETTDYEKTVILETEQGEVPLLNYVSRKEEAEESLSTFIKMVQERLTQTSAY